MKKTPASLVILLSTGLVIWWMSANVVWLGDDLDYQYCMKGALWESWGRITSFREFLDSQWVHYLHVNGRIVAHTLVQLFNGICGQQAFAVCNAAIHVLFAAVLAKCSGVKLSENPCGVLTAVILSILCFITKMMPTCQIGYIWGMLFNLLWIAAFFQKGRMKWVTAAVMLISGIIIGNWQESISLGVCAGLGIWWISQFFNSNAHAHNFLDWRRSWAMTGYFLGTAINAFAPSTMGRVSKIDVPITDQLLISSYSLPAVIILLLCVIIVGLRHGRWISSSFKTGNGSIPAGVLLVGMVSLLIFNSIIGVYSNRQLFGANLFAAILLLRLLPRHRFVWYVNLIGALAVGLTWWIMYRGIEEVKTQYEDIETLHSESSDGSVEYDRTRVMILGHPLAAKYYEDILGQFDNDLHHSMMKDFKHVRKGKTLKLKPTSSMDFEKVEIYAPGHFNVTLKEPPKGEAPREVLVYGHYIFSNIKSAPRRLEVTKYSNRRPPYATSVIIPEYPFFTADSIIIPN